MSARTAIIAKPGHKTFHKYVHPIVYAIALLEPYVVSLSLVEADDGYKGEAQHKVKCPSSTGILEEKQRMMGIVRRRQETVNRRFEQWISLMQVFCHDLYMHDRVFTAIFLISQRAIEPLFQVENDDAA